MLLLQWSSFTLLYKEWRTKFEDIGSTTPLSGSLLPTCLDMFSFWRRCFGRLVWHEAPWCAERRAGGRQAENSEGRRVRKGRDPSQKCSDWINQSDDIDQATKYGTYEFLKCFPGPSCTQLCPQKSFAPYGTNQMTWWKIICIFPHFPEKKQFKQPSAKWRPCGALILPAGLCQCYIELWLCVF